MPNGEDPTHEGPWQVAAGTSGNQRFGGLLRNLRERSGLSAQDLADQADVHVSFVRGIERGAQAPSVATARTMLACMKEQDRIQWMDSGPYDLLVRDPKIGGGVAFQFKAKVKGQNRRADVDPLVGTGAALAAFAEAIHQSLPADVDPLVGIRAGLVSFYEGIQRAVPSVAETGEPRAGVISRAGDDQPRRSAPAEEATFGRVVRLLATADEEMLGRVESLLRDEPGPGQTGS